jgi:hypothetical protein
MIEEEESCQTLLFARLLDLIFRLPRPLCPARLVALIKSDSIKLFAVAGIADVVLRGNNKNTIRFFLVSFRRKSRQLKAAITSSSLSFVATREFKWCIGLIRVAQDICLEWEAEKAEKAKQRRTEL